ncbi:MFS transporter [Hyphomonas oceanitis]|uniref:Major facilitator family transporter n=1 Tax=Hyphomonas oceanitis SCH89 TaxID=1280953 RepID=A0A059G7J3_9PROT|nr:MFS transporter [Hyphomonas oceanitis]KDA02423.1 major facilitator family transporter [Hyphomonas oceanitis SCH89]
MTDTETPLRPLTRLQQGMIALAMVAMGAGMTINFVVVAPLARKAGLAPIEVAGILTFSSALYAFMIPVWGRLADRIGRKRVMVFSLVAMGLLNMAFLFALSAALAGVVTGLAAFFLLAFTRLWFGLLAPGLQPASMAAMTDATTTLTRAGGLGMLGASMSVGSILGPAGAAVLAPFGALVPLWGTIILNIAVGIILAFVLPRTRNTPRESKRPTPLAFNDKRVLPHLVFLFIYFMAIGMIQQTIGWFIEDRYHFVDTAAHTAGEIAVRYTGIIFSCLAVAMIIVQFGYIVPRRPDPRKILPIGLGLVALGYICADTFHPFWAMCVSFLIAGVGGALAVPSANALGSLSVERHEQGSAAALLAAAPPAGFVFGPLIGAGLYSIAAPLTLYASAGVMAVLCIYAFLVTSKKTLTP